MKTFKKVLLLLTVLALMTAVLGACADGNSGDAGSPPSEEASTPEAGGSGSAGETANEIVVGIAQDLDDSLDPHKMSAAGTREVLFNVYEGLVKPDIDGNLIPAVAEDYEISETGDEFTFTLREGVKFHDGSLVTVGDVVYSISRAAGLDTGTALVASLSIIESVEAAGENAVVVRTAEPNIELLAYMTAAQIIPEGSDPAQDSIGTGPFMYVSRSAQENIVLERFDDYWGGAAYLEKVTFRIIENADALVMALKSGAIDLCAHLTAYQAAELDGFTILEGSMNLVQALYLNNAVEPLNDTRVRQAISYALNPQQVMDFIADGRGTAIGSHMYPAFGKYFDDALTDYYAHDVEKAKALLSEAGYENGFDLKITVPGNYQPHVDTAVVLVEQLAQIGISATIETVEWETWVSETYGERKYEATVCGFDASTLTASALLARFVSTDAKNISNFSSAEYDETYALAAASTDDGEQTAYYKRCLEILTEEAANAYIQDLCDIVAMREGLEGYEFYPLYVMDLSTVRFS